MVRIRVHPSPTCWMPGRARPWACTAWGCLEHARRQGHCRQRCAASRRMHGKGIASNARCVAAQVGKFAFVANSRARSVSDTEGLVKFVSDAETDKILGVHIMGPNAGELISECVLVSCAAAHPNTWLVQPR